MRFLSSFHAIPDIIRRSHYYDRKTSVTYDFLTLDIVYSNGGSHSLSGSEELKASWDTCLALCQQFRQTLPGEAKLHRGKTEGNKRREESKVVQSSRLRCSKTQAKQEVETVALLISTMWWRPARLEIHARMHAELTTTRGSYPILPAVYGATLHSFHWIAPLQASVHVTQFIICSFKGN